MAPTGDFYVVLNENEKWGNDKLSMTTPFFLKKLLKGHLALHLFFSCGVQVAKHIYIFYSLFFLFYFIFILFYNSFSLDLKYSLTFSFYGYHLQVHRIKIKHFVLVYHTK
jgi:hypothetical protein